MHKTPCESRLLASGFRWITNPATILLATRLQPVVSKFHTIAKDTKDVVGTVSIVTFETTDRVGTFDVGKLYPSMDVDDTKGAADSMLVNYYRENPVHLWDAIHGSLIMLLMAVLTGQVLSYKFQVYTVAKLFRQVKGITTGLSCAVQPANSFLIAAGLVCLHAYQIDVKVYKRFVGDILVAHDGSMLNMHSMLALFNSSSSFVATHDNQEDGLDIHLLDLRLVIKATSERTPRIISRAVVITMSLSIFVPFFVNRTSGHRN